MKLNFNNKNNFVDISEAPFEYVYPETECVAGHNFRHIAYGVYKADPEFDIMMGDLKEICREYQDLMFGYLQKEGEYEDIYDEEENEDENEEDRTLHVMFAYSETYLQIHNPFSEIFSFGQNDEYLKPYWKAWRECRFDGCSGCGYVGRTMEGKLPPIKYAMRFEWPYEQEELSKGTRKRIMLNGYVGDMVEEGIYYFGNGKLSLGGTACPVVDINSSEFSGAAVFHSTSLRLSSWVSLEYIAIDKKYYWKIKQIAERSGAGYNEFKVRKIEETCDEKEEMEKNSETEAILLNDLVKIGDELEMNAVVEDGAEELVEGLGFRDLEISYHIPLQAVVPFKKYALAYKKGNELVLVSKYKLLSFEKELRVERHDMRLMEDLYVGKEQRLNCGADYMVTHQVIDSKGEKLKELLTPEAYELYKGEL